MSRFVLIACLIAFNWVPIASFVFEEEELPAEVDPGKNPAVLEGCPPRLEVTMCDHDQLYKCCAGKPLEVARACSNYIAQRCMMLNEWPE